MKERPILFSGPMVRAILDGTKTQTRRPIKPQPKHMVIEAEAGITIGMDRSKDGALWYDADCVNPGRAIQCPLGEPSDRLWVKETFYCDHFFYPEGDPDDSVRIINPDGSTRPQTMEEKRAAMLELMYYRADGEPQFEAGKAEWHPSIHMPRWASRITLEIVSVRVQRVREISHHDALAEQFGTIEALEADRNRRGISNEHYFGMSEVLAIDAFQELWNSRYSGDLTWHANPWVWAIEFKRV